MSIKDRKNMYKPKKANVAKLEKYLQSKKDVFNTDYTKKK